MREHSFDVVVIGAGPAGEVCAGRLAERGLAVALVERELVGGECSFYACMPSKALLRPAELLTEVARVPGARAAVTGELDVGAALHRRDEVINNLDDSAQLPWLEDRGVVIVRGHGRLDGERRVSVERAGERETLVAAKAVVLATGSAGVVPPIPGLREAEPWTNREATTARSVPDSLVVLGGGPVGVEMAQAWRSFGARIALIEALPRLLPREEPFAGEQVAEALADRGVDVRVGIKAAAVKREPSGVRVELEDGDELSGEQLLVAIGRRPLSDDLGLETVGLEPGKAVEVDDRMRVAGSESLYAIGDVNGRALLTHIGKYHARLAADEILGRGSGATLDGADAPRVVFTDPEVAAVGLTLELAHERGLNARAVDYPTSANAGASFVGRDAPGTARLVIDEDRKLLVGATFSGPAVADFLHAATIAVVAEVRLERLWHAVPSFPTRSEVWVNLLEEYGL